MNRSDKIILEILLNLLLLLALMAVVLCGCASPYPTASKVATVKDSLTVRITVSVDPQPNTESWLLQICGTQNFKEWYLVGNFAGNSVALERPFAKEFYAVRWTNVVGLQSTWSGNNQ